MVTLAYFDCPTGISGDMCLGALVDAGVPLNYIDRHLKQLGIGNEYMLSSETVHRNGQCATKVHVRLTEAPDEHPYHQEHLGHHDYPHSRHLPDIEKLIREASLPPRVEDWSLAIFQTLAKAEGAVHGVPPEQVHFHEVGATDAIVDIVGACLGLDWLGVDEIYFSALPIGGGTIRAAHGRLPVPVPAVLKLWEMRPIPVYSNGIKRELVTPTGAAIATTLATDFGTLPEMVLTKVGMGAGSHNLSVPNILRLLLGNSPSTQKASHHTVASSSGHAHPYGHSHTPHEHPHEQSKNHFYNHSQGEEHPTHTDLNFSENGGGKRDVSAIANHTTVPVNEDGTLEQVIVLETQIDDLNPQAIGFLFDALFQVGALDVLTQPVGMKKCRPGILITVICRPSDVAACESVLFRETTTLGIRRTAQVRSPLHREIKPIETPHGNIRIKIARRTPHSPILNVQPEYEDCAAIARATNLPWITIHQEALHCWFALHGASNA